MVIRAQISVFFLTLFLLPTSFSGIATVYFSLGFISYARAELKSNSNELANDLFLAKSIHTWPSCSAISSFRFFTSPISKNLKEVEEIPSLFEC